MTESLPDRREEKCGRSLTQGLAEGEGRRVCEREAEGRAGTRARLLQSGSGVYLQPLCERWSFLASLSISPSGQFPGPTSLPKPQLWVGRGRFPRSARSARGRLGIRQRWVWRASEPSRAAGGAGQPRQFAFTPFPPFFASFSPSTSLLRPFPHTPKCLFGPCAQRLLASPGAGP